MLPEHDFGKIEFIRSQKSRHIRVRILRNGLKVSLPWAATENEALNFISQQHQKIKAKQQQLQKNELSNPTVLRNNSRLQTLTFDVEIKAGNRKNIFFSMKNGLLIVEHPEQVDINDEIIQKQCWTGIEYFLRKEAKRLLPERTKQLALKFGFTHSGVKIQSSKSRWGSCSREKNINLSFYLMLLPAHLVDYVILHELCHTKEMNHGEKFWKWIDKVTDEQSKQLRAELKKYHMPQ